MITHDTGSGDTAASFTFAFASTLIARLVEMHFIETVLLALFCGFLGTFAKHAGAFAWKICFEIYSERKGRKSKKVPVVEIKEETEKNEE